MVFWDQWYHRHSLKDNGADGDKDLLECLVQIDRISLPFHTQRKSFKAERIKKCSTSCTLLQLVSFIDWRLSTLIWTDERLCCCTITSSFARFNTSSLNSSSLVTSNSCRRRFTSAKRVANVRLVSSPFFVPFCYSYYVINSVITVDCSSYLFARAQDKHKQLDIMASLSHICWMFQPHYCNTTLCQWWNVTPLKEFPYFNLFMWRQSLTHIVQSQDSS